MFPNADTEFGETTTLEIVFGKHVARIHCFVDVDLKSPDNKKQKNLLTIVTKVKKKLIPHLSQNFAT